MRIAVGFEEEGGKEMNAIQTKHNLDFEAADWVPVLPMATEYMAFRIGTCEGLYTSTAQTYDILAVSNSVPGNGHFEDVLQWFEHSCKRDKKNLRFLEVMNKEFKKHLIVKRGFRTQGENVIKKIK